MAINDAFSFAITTEHLGGPLDPRPGWYPPTSYVPLVTLYNVMLFYIILNHCIHDTEYPGTMMAS